MLTTGQAIGDRGDIKTITKIDSPKPLEINIEENKTPHNVREISEQRPALTKLDWNTINQTRELASKILKTNAFRRKI